MRRSLFQPNFRRPLIITLSVWKALFLREMITRLSLKRGAWAWLLLDPIIQIVLMLLMFTFLRIKIVSGIDVLAWLIMGMTSYNLFSRTATQIQNGFSANKALFTYRQVKPLDALFVRAYLEGIIELMVILIVSCGAVLLADVKMIPDDPLLVLIALFGLWLLGLGYGLIKSAVTELVPETGRFFNYIAMPLHMSSGAIIPISGIAQPYRDWLMYNPLVSGLEAARFGISSVYHVIPGADLLYVYQCALVAVFLGLALQIRYSAKMLSA